MSIPKFTKLVTTAVPLPIENVDTDQIIPARFLKAVERKGFGDNLFMPHGPFSTMVSRWSYRVSLPIFSGIMH